MFLFIIQFINVLATRVSGTQELVVPGFVDFFDFFFNIMFVTEVLQL